MGNSNKLILMGITMILSIGIVVALGVNSPYWQDNPLKMYPGESQNVVFSLVNGINEPTTEASVTLIEGSEIAEITSGEKYVVNPGEKDKNIILNIKIPANAPIESNYSVKFVVRYSPQGDEGNVKLDVEYNVNFPVEVVGLENASSTNQPTPIKGEENNTTLFILLFIILLVIIIIVIIFIIIKRRSNQTIESL